MITSPRVRRASTAALLAVTLAAGGTGCAPEGRHAAYCAYLPDTVGLYVGNPVTQMGYPVGTITSIQTGPARVRVDFTMTEQRELPGDVKAIIRSPSILADRSMELVGNYADGPKLEPTGCIPLERSISPKTLSEVIGSADTFLNAINSAGSDNIADSIGGLDRLVHNNGAAAGQLLTLSSTLLDSPDQAVSDLGSIIENTAELTDMLTEMRGPLKGILQDAAITTGDVVTVLDGGGRLNGADGYGTLGPLIESVAVLETRLGDETQITLDAVSTAVRKVTPHSNALAALFNPVPWWINSLANHVNTREFGTFNIAYRPPLYRVPTHDGLLMCGVMNAATPGSCADVNGQPYAVDVALLQYVLQEASRR
ncbi:MlaD family protein [Mycolicibacterium holsaticum]|uniref:MlaD family protein n=1 Tax=Mycolicibacterium holsaticum TaxID=152142 RepID=UPI000A0275CA|nr:MlaD family protein [Mycolicibacterium holsaticum]QZA12752.1 MlaD family protein [Mycolicibacterium holsaticum DSM 44478 = JCM 12374]UNC09774.1 MCE family protein [Mycolicibacterium holsaticum DSM 44478 = JCM 12374]